MEIKVITTTGEKIYANVLRIVEQDWYFVLRFDESNPENLENVIICRNQNVLIIEQRTKEITTLNNGEEPKL